MATTTYVENGLNTPNGSHLAFSYTFPVLKTEDVKVALNGVTQATTKYAVDNTSNPTRITFNNTSIDSDLQESTGAPKTGVIVRVYRDTDVDSAKAIYAAGSSIRALDLNNNHDQVLYALQEEQNQKGIFESISLDDNVSIKLGNSDDATIKYDGNNLDLTSAGDIELNGSTINMDGPFRVRPNGNGIRLIVDDDKIISLVQIYPFTGNQYDLGTSSKQWKDLYVDGTGYIDTISADTATINGNLVVTGTISDSGGNLELADDVNISGHIRLPDDKKLYLGNGDDAYIDWDTDGWVDRLEITSTGDIKTTAGDGKFYAWYIGSTFVSQWFNDRIQYRVRLEPQSNNSLDLGTSTLQWKDLYVDGTGYIDTVNADDITGSAIVTSGTSTSDTKVYSAKRSDALYFAKASGEEIASGETWVADDNKIATTAAIDARIVDLVDDVGGFVPIANETSFPNANPDVNNGAGTLVSVPLANSYTANGSGQITIPNGTVGNSTVTIIGAEANATYETGFGLIVETESLGDTTYRFHRYVPKATEVTTVAGSIANVNTVAGNTSNINTVAGISGNVTTVAGIASNVTTVANDGTDIGTVAGISSNVTTVAGISANVTSVAGNATNINTCATNISAITGASTQATNAATSATNAASSATTASTQATNAASSATSAASSATTATTQASTATTQASNASTSAANALAYKNLALTYRNDANGILTQVESAPYNLADNVSSHTAWGDITDTGANAVFSNESSNIHLTMSEGSSSYNYGSIT